MVVMLVIVTMALLAIMVVVMLVIVAMALLAIMVVVMLVIVTMALLTVVMVVMLVIVTMALLAVVMVVMMRLCLGKSGQLLLNGIAAFHCGKQLLSIQLPPGSGYDNGRSIMLLKKRNGLLDLLFGYVIGVRKHDASCVFDLIVEELSEITHIHLALVYVSNGSKAV